MNLIESVVEKENKELNQKIKTLENTIQEKYDQLNKDLFDFKDTLKLTQMRLENEAKKIKKSYFVCITTTVLFNLFFFTIRKKCFI